MKLAKATVFLPVENTARELDYKLNLARYFCKSGFDVIIGNPPFIREELKYKNYKGILLEKGVNPDPKFYNSLVQKGVQVYDLSDEGANTVYSINFQPIIDSLNCVRRIFLWGNKQLNQLTSRNLEPTIKNKYHVLGYPAFDLSLPKYKEMYKQLKPKNLPENYILINTNFACFNGYNMSEQLKACNNNISSETYNLWVESYESEEKEFTLFKAYVEEIIRSFPKEKFLIRPHPAEIQRNYEKLFLKYPNVVISKKGNINEVIADAKVVLHKNCTTALQSYLMGVPVVSLGSSLMELQYQWPYAFGFSPKNVEDALEKISILLKDGKWDDEMQSTIDKNAKEIMDSYFYNIGKSTIDLISIILADTNASFSTKKYQLRDIRSGVKKMKCFVRKFLPLYYKLPKAARETMVPFNKKEVITKLKLFEQFDPLNLKFQVRKIFPNTFHISQKKEL